MRTGLGYPLYVNGRLATGPVTVTHAPLRGLGDDGLTPTQGLTAIMLLGLIGIGLIGIGFAGGELLGAQPFRPPHRKSREEYYELYGFYPEDLRGPEAYFIEEDIARGRAAERARRGRSERSVATRQQDKRRQALLRERGYLK